MKDIIEGLKTLGRIANIVITDGLKGMANTYEVKEKAYKEEEDLKQRWINELNYYSYEEINEELKRCGIYHYNVEYDVKNACINKIADYKVAHDYKVC